MEQPFSVVFPDKHPPPTPHARPPPILLPVVFTSRFFRWRRSTAPVTNKSTFIYKAPSHIQRRLKAQSKEKPRDPSTATMCYNKSATKKNSNEKKPQTDPQTPDGSHLLWAVGLKRKCRTMERRSGREAGEIWKYTWCGFCLHRSSGYVRLQSSFTDVPLRDSVPSLSSACQLATVACKHKLIKTQNENQITLLSCEYTP